MWRRIQVPDEYTFWDLHVAIQDAMGWQDYHLHEFQVVSPTSGQLVAVGIPDDDGPGEKHCLMGSQLRIADYFPPSAPLGLYLYDFGDDWQHMVMHEGPDAAELGASYPRCISGAGPCPPEDCGGAHGYSEFLIALRNPEHPEHADTVRWAEGHYDPRPFEPGRVKFDDPRERWKHVFEA